MSFTRASTITWAKRGSANSDACAISSRCFSSVASASSVTAAAIRSTSIARKTSRRRKGSSRLMREALGIYREERFSPGKVADDRAIIDLAAAELRRAGVVVRMSPGERLPSLDQPPALVFAMCQSPAALEWMDEAAKRAIVVNHPSAIRACYRANLLARLDEAGVPQPRWGVARKEPPA